MQPSMPTFRLNGSTAEQAAPPVPTKSRGRKSAGRARTTKRPAPTTDHTLARFRLWMTVILGIGIPLLSLAMSKLAGTLAAAGMYALAAFSLGLMVAVLGVSLSHLAWGIADITRSSPRASWALAVALDLSLVLCELCLVSARGLGLEWVAALVMGAVAIASMALNVYAFLMHE